ncbi:MAG: acyltransferase [Candidatus Eremiobacteraeota bacterium]|nr:acyltransferase [Candidatus Eremiobacteraeota bacterium]
MERRLDGIDGLRGIAIALVVAYHSWLVYGCCAGLISEAGFLGVELFFALSGFCIFYPYASAQLSGAAPPSWAAYSYRRAIKIVPSYVLALSVFALAYARRDGLEPTATAYLAHMFFIHPLIARAFQAISGPLWTIGIEVQFYFIFPLLCGFFLRRPLAVAAVVLLVAGGYRLAVLSTHPDPGFFLSNQVIAFLDLFAAGMLAAYVVAWVRTRYEQAAIQRAATPIALVAIAAAAVGMFAFAHSAAMNDSAAFFVWQMQWRSAIAGLLFVMVTSTVLALPGMRRLIANPASTFLAIISYNLYLWHLEILSLAQRVQLPFIFALLAALAVGAAATYLVERPLLRARLKRLDIVLTP